MTLRTNFADSTPSPTTHAAAHNDANIAANLAEQRQGTSIGSSVLVTGSVVLTFSSVWGISSLGQPYYDPAGAAAGEAAVLSIDSVTGAAVLTRPAGATP